MESLTINGALVPIPDEVVGQGRAAVAAWVSTQSGSTTAPAPTPKPARERTPEA